MVSRSFVLAAIGVLFASVSAQNLVLNGDFEALSIGNSVPGTPKVEGGWIFENYCGVETNGNPGKSSRLESNGSTSFDPTASQTVSGLQIGETYTIAWDWKLRVNYSGRELDAPSVCFSTIKPMRALSSLASAWSQRMCGRAFPSPPHRPAIQSSSPENSIIARTAGPETPTSVTIWTTSNSARCRNRHR